VPVTFQVIHRLGVRKWIAVIIQTYYSMEKELREVLGVVPKTNLASETRNMFFKTPNPFVGRSC
jgi:hypothetical protein